MESWCSFRCHGTSTPPLCWTRFHPTKDVDAFHPENVGLMLQGRPRFLPCTPAGVMKLLEVSNVPTAGQHAVVIGRSDIVGRAHGRSADAKRSGLHRPLSVTVARKTSEPCAVMRTSSLPALGIPEFVRGTMIKPGAVVIDVGINRVGDKLVGDVHYAEASAVASAITPVPGGVGPMTIAMLLQNTLKAAQGLWNPAG